MNIFAVFNKFIFIKTPVMLTVMVQANIANNVIGN